MGKTLILRVFFDGVCLRIAYVSKLTTHCTGKHHQCRSGTCSPQGNKPRLRQKPLHMTSKRQAHKTMATNCITVTLSAVVRHLRSRCSHSLYMAPCSATLHMGLLRFDLFEVMRRFLAEGSENRQEFLLCFCQNDNVKSKSES